MNRPEADTRTQIVFMYLQQEEMSTVLCIYLLIFIDYSEARKLTVKLGGCFKAQVYLLSVILNSSILSAMFGLHIVTAPLTKNIS